MTIPISLRTIKTEARYQEDRRSGRTRDIALEPAYEIVSDTKIVKNNYPYDLTFSRCDMTLSLEHQQFMEWWMNVGLGILEEQFEGYDKFIYNFPHKQSQPHIPHGHLVNEDPRKIAILRTLWEQWSEDND